MFKPVSAKEERLLPVYVYGSESLEHQAQISRGKGFMLHSQISVCYSGEGVFTDHNNVSHKVQSGDIMYFTSETSNSYKPISVPWKTDYIVMGGYALIELMMFLGYSKSGVIHLTENIKEKVKDAAGAMVRATITEDYKAPEHHHRMTQEFTDFARVIDEKDYETAKEFLDETVAVVKVLETARKKAGIEF